MRVYAYTSEKVIVPAEMPVEEVVRLRIDPLKFDLFQDMPVIREEAGEKLFFQRQQSTGFLSLADRNTTPTHCRVAVRTPHHSFSYQGIYSDEKIVNDIRPTEPCFDALCRTYLSDPDGSEFGSKAIWQVEPHVQPVKGGVKITKSMARFKSWYYSGRSIEEESVYFETPPCINWLFTDLPGYLKVSIMPSTVREIMSGTVATVRFRYSFCDLQAVLRNKGISADRVLSPITFHRDGIAYVGESRIGEYATISDDAMYRADSAYSADTLCIRQPNAVLSTRLGWFDSKRNQSRPLTNDTGPIDELVKT